MGDVATVFFRGDGSSDGIVLNERSTGPALAQLSQVRRRICVVSGASKINGLRGALTAGLATDLILDEASARRLVGFDGGLTACTPPSPPRESACQNQWVESLL